MNDLVNVAKTYAQTELQRLSEAIQQRHRLAPTPLIPLRQSEWTLLEELIALAYMDGAVYGMDQAIERVATNLLTESLTRGVGHA